MTDWTPETNRIPWVLLTEDEKAALKACEYGWEGYAYSRGTWLDTISDTWARTTIYRAKPAPKRIMTWHNVNADGGFSSAYITRKAADAYAYHGRICVYRIERNEDGSDPTIEVEGV